MRYLEVNEDLFNHPKQYVIAHCISVDDETGASEEAKRHNRIVWQDIKEYQWHHK